MQRETLTTFIRVSGVLSFSLFVVMLGGLLKPEAAVQPVSFDAKTECSTGSNLASATASTATQLSQEGSKLMGTGAVGAAQQGSVSLSAESSTAIIGGNSENASAVAASVFTACFGAKIEFGVGTRPRSVAVGDFNGDGKSDLAVANTNSNTVSILLATGAGIFGAKTDFGTGNGPISIAVADLNGDGKLDLAVANSVVPGKVSILLGTGTGSFGVKTDFGTGSSFAWSVAVGDFNGDLNLDLAVANAGALTVSILLGTGTGTFGAKTDFVAASVPNSVAVCDFNGDGNLDLAVANFFSNSVSILLGTGTGSFGPKTDFGTGTAPSSVTVGDFNSDGNLDLAAANKNVGTVSILLGTGTGSFAAKTDFGTLAFPVSVAVGDFNGDSKLDLAVANSGDFKVSILLGTGTGSFGAQTVFLSGSAPASVAASDFDGDSTLDLAVANFGSNTASILLNTCNTPPPACSSGICVTNLRARQLGDGSNRVEVLYDLGNAPPSGTFVSVLFSDNGGSSYGIAPGTAALSGDLGPGIANGSNRRILWSAEQTLPAQTFGNSFRSAVTVGSGASTGFSNLFSVDLRSQSQVPIASFSFLPQSPATGQLVQFNDESPGTVVSWAWDFNGDGFIDSSARNPSRTFTTPGPHQVTLRINNAYGSSRLTQTVSVGLTSGVPVVTGVRRQYEGVFLQNSAFDNSFDVFVNWSGSPGHVRFSVNGGAPFIKPGTLNGASHTFHMASDFLPNLSPSRVTITPVNSQGIPGPAWIEQVYVFPYPAWLQLAGSAVNSVVGTGEVNYQLLNLEFPQPHLGEGQDIQLPSIARSLLGAKFGATDVFGFVRGGFTSRGIGSLTIGAQGGLQGSFQAMDSSLAIKVAGSGDFNFLPPKGLDLTDASFEFNLQGTLSKEVGIADAIPGLRTLEDKPWIGAPIRFFNERAKLMGELGGSGGGLWQWKQGTDGRLHFAQGTGTLGFDMKGTLRARVWENRISASAWLSGGGSLGVGVPDPFLRTAEVHLQAGASLTLDFWKVRFCPGATWNLGCSWTPADGWRCDSGGDTSAECTPNSPSKVSLTLIKPNYDRFGKYSSFRPVPRKKAQSSKTPVTTSELSLISNLYSDAAPTLVQAGSGRVLLWTHQDPLLPVQQSTGIAWSYDDGSSWSGQALIADDTRAEFSQVAARDNNGKVVAAWLRIKDPAFSTPIENLDDLPLFYTRLEVVSAVFDPGTQTWGPITQVTDDAAMDTNLRIASDASGHLLLSWFSNQGAELISTTALPSTLKYCFWNGSAWSTPGAVATGLVGVGYHASAVNGSSALIVLHRDPDPNASADGLLETFFWNGTSWTSAAPFADGAEDNRLPSAAYDQTGSAHIVWVRGNDLVHALLGNPAPEIVRAGSGSISFYGAQFFTNAQGNLTLVRQEVVDNGPANIFAMLYDPSSQTWSSDLRLTEDTSEAHGVSGFHNTDGRLNLVYLATDILRTSENVTVGNGVPLTINNIPQDGQTDLRLLEHSLIIDLAVVDSNLSITPQGPLVGEPVTATLDIHNAGDFPVGTFIVHLYAGSPEAGGMLVGSSTVAGPLAGGANRMVTISFVYPASGGDIVAIIDAASAIPEFSEVNNRAIVYLTNSAPQVRLLATPTSGAPPLSVILDASASFDNESDAMFFSWTFGDGSPSANGAIVSNTFNTIGLYPVTVTVSDARGALATAVVTISVGCPQLAFTPDSLPDAALGGPYNQTLTVSGGDGSPTTYVVDAGTLPPGLSLSSSGVIAGIPTSLGTFSFRVIASDSNGCPGQHDYAINVACQYSLSSPGASFPAGGGVGSVNVSCGNACLWTAASNDSWINVTSGSSGNGNGTVEFSVATNASPERAGTVTIAGQTFTVTQDSGCSFALGAPGQTFGSEGGTGSVNVTGSVGCDWIATSNDSWITITSTPNGSGNGSLDYSVAANASGDLRTGTMTIAGQTFTVDQSNNPTAVNLESFVATAYDSGVFIEWRTGLEVENLGFHIYRDEGGQRVRVTPEIVAGSALIAGNKTTLTAGNSYGWFDAVAKGKQDAQYWLEDLDIDGKSTLHGPISPKRIAGLPPEQSTAALLSRVGKGEPRVSQAVADQTAPAGPSQKQFQTQWDIARKPAIKLTIKEEGWYRVTRQELLAAGLDPKADPRNLQLYLQGEEQAMLVAGEEDGSFDQQDGIEFYATGQDVPYTDARTYWLVSSKRPGMRITIARSEGQTGGSSSFSYTIERKERTIYFSSLKNGDAENFFGRVITPQPVDQELTLHHLDQTSQADAVLEVALQGVTDLPGVGNDHQVRVTLNGGLVGRIFFDGRQHQVERFAVPPGVLKEGDNVVSLVAEGGPSDISLVDYVRVTYRHTFTADQDTLRMTEQASPGARRSQTIDGFNTSSIRVFDISNPGEPQELIGRIEEQKGGQFAATVEVTGNNQRTLMALTADRIKHPVSITANQSSSWREKAHSADLLMITHRAFADSLAPLKVLRQKQGFVTEVVDIEDIYDEFSFGEPSARAVRDFLTYAHASWQRAPRFVLFAGDASFDPRNYLGAGEFDFVPTKLIDTTYLETASDDWFVDFNEDGLPEMYVGRLPVRSAAETAALVAKIANYDSVGIKSPTARRSLLLVADKNDGFNFEQASEQLRALVPTGTGVQEIFRGRLDDAGAKKQLIEAINAGQSIVNYTGHGSTNVWRSLFTTEDVRLLNNQAGLPLFVTMTCLNGFFQDPVTESLAEGLLKSERGGAIAVWASSGLTAPSQQALMNQQAYRLLFGGTTGLTIGEAMSRAKASVSDSDIRRTWILFGDPTTVLR